MDKLLTVQEAAAYLEVSESTVYRLCSCGSLPNIKKNFGIRIKHHDLEKWLEQDKRETILAERFLNKALTKPFAINIDKAKGDRSKLTKKGQTCWNYGFGSIYTRETKSGILRWYICYYNAKRERVRKVVLHVSTKQEALIELKNEVLKALGKRDETEQKKEKITFKEFAQIYLENYSMVKKRAWERSDKVYLNANLIPYFGSFELAKIDTLLVERFIAKRLDDDVKKSTINRDISCLKKMFNKAIDWDYLRENPLARIRQFPEKDNVRVRILSEEEEARLLEESAEHLRPIIVTALHTGMRRGEILNLSWTQVDLKARRIRVEKTKSGEMRFIPINDVLQEELLELRSRNGQSPYVFFNPETGKPLTTVKTAFNAASRRASIEGLRMHDLRRSFATRLLQKGADIETVRSLLGQHSILVTQRYVHSDDDRKKKTVELLSKERGNTAKKREYLAHHRHTERVESLEKLPAYLFSVN